jgi:hypothetical protein
MFDREGYEFYVRQRVRLEIDLADEGRTNVSAEVEMQMRNAEERLLARIKQAHYHAQSEVDALRFVMREATKKEDKPHE